MSNTTQDNDLMKASAKYILGESTGVQIKGTSEKLNLFHEVLAASKNLYDALCEEQSFDKITSLIEAKKKAASNFRKITGIVWRL